MSRHIRSLLLGACVVAAALLPAASALAAPDHSFELSSAQPTASWQGKLGSGLITLSGINALPGCGTPTVHDCDYTLLHVTEPGSIEVDTSADGPNSHDVALQVYDSDATGTKGDSETGNVDASDATESAAVENDQPAGADIYYLVEISYLTVIEGQPNGKATFTPATP
jgi:hypothetical protein